MLIVPATIAEDATSSAAISLARLGSSDAARHALVCGLLLPAGVTASTILIKGSVDGATFYTIRDRDGSGMPVTVTEGLVSLDPTEFSGFPYLKLVGDTAQLTADADIKLILREF